MCGKGSFDRAVSAIRQSLDAGVRTHICSTAMLSNAHLLTEMMIDLTLELGVDGFNLSQFVPIGRGSAAGSLTRLAAQRPLEGLARRQGAAPSALSERSLIGAGRVVAGS